ncbi:hypothetical protein ACFQH9_22775 [Pseudonocardia lutea]|jgi:hypothetical protein|uniref:Uncharacterized protein n=1 Tax=Pseudonocardia lutea TaxID=2172015 RepID=A0ABW1ICX4_9PSEU
MADQDDAHVVTEVTARQVRAARFRVERDSRQGRATPERIRRLARVLLPGEESPQPG